MIRKEIVRRLLSFDPPSDPRAYKGYSLALFRVFVTLLALEDEELARFKKPLEPDDHFDQWLIAFKKQIEEIKIPGEQE